MTPASARPIRRALITGGCMGIGPAIVHALTRDAVECTITGRAEARPKDLTGEVGYMPLDYRDEASLRQAMCVAGKRLRPDILINNAGMNEKAPIADVSDDDLGAIVETNLTGPYWLTRTCLPAMIERRWGRVVNISSIWSLVGNAGNSAYCASKFGLDGFTASLAAELAHKGILVNAVAPEYIATEALLAKYSLDDIEQVEAHIPVGRLGKRDEIAELVAFLASDRNGYVSGQNICTDGQLTGSSHPSTRY